MRHGSYDPSAGWDVRGVDDMIRDEELEARRARYVDNPIPVTRRIRMVRQPRGGWLPVSAFTRVELGDSTPLRPITDVPPSVLGLAVDYLSRVACGDDPFSAFSVPLAGARLVGETPRAVALAHRVRGFDDESVAAAVLLCSYDVASRRGPGRFRGARRRPPTRDAVWSIRRMVARTLAFLDEYGPVTWDGFTFEGGYTDQIGRAHV